MTRSRGTEIDRVLEIVVGEINSSSELQDGGPHVVLTLGGSVVSGTIIPDWQWFDEVEHAARAGFTVDTGGSIDDEHGGWARLFRGVSESLVRDREEHRTVQNVVGGLSERYRRLLAEEARTSYIHLSGARVLAPGVGPSPHGGVHWRGRLSEISGWTFGHFGEASPGGAVRPGAHPRHPGHASLGARHVSRGEGDLLWVWGARLRSFPAPGPVRGGPHARRAGQGY